MRMTAQLRERVMEVMRREFLPEFLNRIDEVIFFHPLGKGEIREIVDLQIIRLQHQLEEEGYAIEVTPAAKERVGRRGLRPGLRGATAQAGDPAATAKLARQRDPGRELSRRARRSTSTLPMAAWSSTPKPAPRPKKRRESGESPASRQRKLAGASLGFRGSAARRLLPRGLAAHPPPVANTAEIHNPLSRPTTAVEFDDRFGRHLERIVLRLVIHAGNVPGQEHVVEREERAVDRQRFDLEHVEPGGSQSGRNAGRRTGPLRRRGRRGPC